MNARALAAASLAVALGACSVPEHENPYDPQTPPPLQARATLRGTVTLERLGDEPPALEGVNVSVSGIGAAVTNAAGEWLLAQVPQGSYTVQTIKEGYETAVVSGVVVELDDGGQDVWVAPVTMRVARGTLAGVVQLSAGAVDGFQPGTDRSGVVVTLSGTGVPLPAAVTDAAGAYRFVDVPASVAGGAYTVSARKPFYAGDEATASVTADATATAPLLTLTVNPSSATGEALLWDNVANGGANDTSAGIDVSLTGTAFDGTAFSRATTTLASGAFALDPLPAGTYDVVATSATRACGAFARVTVTPGDTISLGAVGCVDTVAPSAVVLGDPVAPSGGESGYARTATVAVPVAVQAEDATAPASNFAGYQLFVGPVADWDRATPVAGAPAALVFTGLAPNARNTLWARGVDWVGNAGPAGSVQVVHDGIAPPAPAISTPRAAVDATTTSVTLSGSEKDATFSGYQTCAQAVAATANCPLAPPCTFADAPGASFALSLAAGQRTCLYARAVDRAGNASAAAVSAIVADLQPPAGPSIAPLFDPTSLRVQGEYVDFSVTAPATDGPAGGGAAWQDVAWVEVDTGNGFVPLCPSASCRPGNVYSPCAAGCSCSDPARLCRGTTFVGVRLPLAANRANEISVRAVDLAGNVGSGAAQQVVTRQNESLIQANPGIDESPRVRGRLLVFASQETGTYEVRMTDLGTDGVPGAGDATCSLGPAGAFTGPPKGEAASADAVAFVNTPRYLGVARRGPDGAWCTPDDARVNVLDVGTAAAIHEVSASPDAGGKRERAAFAQYDPATWKSWAIKVVEPGADGLLGPGDAAVTLVAGSPTFVTSLRLGGDVLLYAIGTSWTVVNAGPAGFAAGTTTWALPSSAAGAGLSSDGKTLAWVDGASPPALHVKPAGADGDFDAADPEIALQGTGPAIGAYGAHVAVEAGHVAVVESALVSSTTYAVHHWSAGGDGAFGSGDDTYARILPSSRPRYRPSLSGGIAAGILYYTIGRSGISGEDPDILVTDLTATRWEVAGDAAVGEPRPNGAGTLFYRDVDGWVAARTSDGRETRAGAWAGAFAADGDRLYYASGTRLWVASPDAAGQFFTAAAPPDLLVLDAPDRFYAKLEAHEGLVFAEAWNGGDAERSVVRWDGATATAVRVDDPALFPGVSQHTSAFGLGLSSRHAAWGCLDGGYWRPCVRSAVNGVFGDGDDVSVIPELPSSPGARYATANIHVAGNRLVLAVYGAGYHLVVLDAGPDERFNTGDEVELDLGAIQLDSVVSTDVAGDFVAWSDFVPGLGGTQIRLLDMRDLSVRTLTDWYSFKPEVRVEPSGRIYWVDQVFQANAIFVRTP